MISSKEKAKELFEWFYDYVPDHSTSVMSTNSAVQCAIRCVDEILDNSGTDKVQYYTEVKQELLLLKKDWNEY